MATPHKVDLNPREKTVVIMVRPTYQDAESPELAIFRLDQVLIDKVHQCRKTVVENEAMRIVKAHNILWEDAGQFSLQGPGLVVDPHWFWFTAYPEFGGGYDVETSRIHIDSIEDLLSDDRPVLYYGHERIFDDEDAEFLVEDSADLRAEFNKHHTAPA